MQNIPHSIKFFIQLAKTQAKLTYRFDRVLGGLGFTEFLILYHLDQSPDGHLSRVELAEKVGLTASGVTRLLLPMAKIHLIKDGVRSSDARVRTVEATVAGRQKLAEELVRLKFLTDDLIPGDQKKELESLAELLRDIGGRLATA